MSCVIYEPIAKRIITAYLTLIGTYSTFKTEAARRSFLLVQLFKGNITPHSTCSFHNNYTYMYMQEAD